MTKKKIALLILIVLVVVVVIAAFIVDSKYAVVWSSPRISHATLVKPESRAVVAINLPLARDFITKRFLANSGVPAWAVSMVLPYEAALVADVDPGFALIRMTMFINDKRLGPVICDQLNGARLAPPLSQWFLDKMAAAARGSLIRKGSAPVDAMVASKVRAQWRNAQVRDPLDIEGGHAIEAAIDNRDGSGVAIVAAAMQGNPLVGQYLSTEGYLGVLANIGDVRIQGDLTPDNALQVHVIVHAASSAKPEDMPVLKMLLDLAVSQIRGISIQGASKINGAAVEGDYTISNVDALLARL